MVQLLSLLCKSLFCLFGISHFQKYFIFQSPSHLMFYYLLTLQEFLSVELRRGKVRFSWNNGKGVARIDHDIEIKSEADVISETESWYKVIAER